MSFKATLNIDNRTLNILYCEFDFARQVNKEHFPVSFPQSGFITIYLEAQRDDFFETWGISATQKKSGSIIFYKRDNLSILKQLIMSDVYCVSFKEKYQSLGHHPFYVEVKLSAGELRYGESVYRNPWFVNEGEEKDLNGKQVVVGYDNADKPATYLRQEEPDAGNAFTNNSNIVPSGSVPEEPVNSMELDEVLVTGEEKVILQQVEVVPGEPGFIKKYIVKPLYFGISATINATCNIVAATITAAVPAFITTPLSNYTGDQSIVDPSWDGKILSCADCNNSKGSCMVKQKEPFTPAPAVHMPGKKPTDIWGNSCMNPSLKKMYYINGINTTPEGNCETSKLLANTLCAEVTSVYNRTEGTFGDLAECVRSIRKGGDVPPLMQW